MSIRHPEQRLDVRRGEDDVPSHESLSTLNSNRRRKHMIIGAAAVAGLAVAGVVAVSGAGSGEAKAKQKSATTMETATPGASTPPSPSEVPPAHAINTVPLSILNGSVYATLDPATQQDVLRLNRESLSDFEKEPAGERAEFSSVFDATYRAATKTALAPYDAGGTATRLVPNVDPDPTKTGQEKLTQFSFDYDTSLVSLEVNGNPNTLTGDLGRRLQAQKNLAGLVFSTDIVTYSSPYTAMQYELSSATSFSPSKATETNFTAPDVAFRESPMQPANTSPNGDPFMVVNDEPNEPLGVANALQYNFVADKGLDGKINAMLVSIMSVNDQFAIPQDKLVDNY